MNDQQQATQRTLFEPQWPKWETLPSEVRRATVEALAQMLLQNVAPEFEINSQTTPAQETQS